MGTDGNPYDAAPQIRDQNDCGGPGNTLPGHSQASSPTIRRTSKDNAAAEARVPTESWTADDGCANNGCDHDRARRGDHNGSAIRTAPAGPITVPTRTAAARDEGDLRRTD